MTADSHLFKTKNVIPHAHVIHTADNSRLSVSHIDQISTSTLSLPNIFLILKLSLNLIFID